MKNFPKSEEEFMKHCQERKCWECVFYKDCDNFNYNENGTKKAVFALQERYQELIKVLRKKKLAKLLS